MFKKDVFSAFPILKPLHILDFKIEEIGIKRNKMSESPENYSDFVDYAECWASQFEKLRLARFSFEEVLVFPWKVQDEIICFTCLDFESQALLATEILFCLEHNFFTDFNTFDFQTKMCRAHTLSVEALSCLKKWRKPVPANIFFCESRFYDDIIKFTTAAYATSVISGVDEIDAGMRDILLSCERELSATLPSTRESKWLLANSKAMRQKSYGDERYARQEWGEALYHQNKRNSFLQDMHDITNDSWLSSRGTVPEADTKRTNELNTICTGLRISEKQTEQKEVVAPLPNMPVIGEFVKSCFNDQK